MSYSAKRPLALSLLTLMLLIVVSGPAFYLWDANRNRGFTWGYYGDFNSLSNALAGLSEVTITNSYHLEEIHGLELFTFDLLVAGQSMHLRFPQDDPVRDLRTTALTNALIQRIAEEKSNLSNLKRPQFGVIELYREEENGSVNILPCTLTLSDGSRLNLRGGETVSLRVSSGDISVTAASNDPYSNEARPEAWRSEKTTFSIAEGEKLRVLIEPAATNSAYTGAWLIRRGE